MHLRWMSKHCTCYSDDNVASTGQFEVNCKTTDHYHGGMRANYTVEKCRFWNRQSETMLHQKKYYIAAVEMDWDYSPTRTWEDKMHNGLKERYSNLLYQNSQILSEDTTTNPVWDTEEHRWCLASLTHQVSITGVTNHFLLDNCNETYCLKPLKVLIYTALVELTYCRST